ncbi:MAG: hypothetical protein Q7S05_00505 [bacterium]|nr:hypothetical protein [bacterium]
MFEKPNRKPGIPTAFDLTNSALRLLGKGIGVAAKTGYNALEKASNEQFRKSALDEIHSIIYPGAILKPGHLLPPLRTTNLTPDEVKGFTRACNGLIDRKIPLEPYIKSFAARFYIRLRN